MTRIVRGLVVSVAALVLMLGGVPRAAEASLIGAKFADRNHFTSWWWLFSMAKREVNHARQHPFERKRTERDGIHYRDNGDRCCFALVRSGIGDST